MERIFINDKYYFYSQYDVNFLIAQNGDLELHQINNSFVIYRGNEPIARYDNRTDAIISFYWHNFS